MEPDIIFEGVRDDVNGEDSALHGGCPLSMIGKVLEYVSWLCLMYRCLAGLGPPKGNNPTLCFCLYYLEKDYDVQGYRVQWLDGI